jgi:hypothetical protein
MSVITVIEGSTESVQLDLAANPIPGDDMFEWFMDGNPLTSGGDVVLGVNSIDFISGIVRSQAGIYTVQSSNIAGASTGNDTFQLEVLCMW